MNCCRQSKAKIVLADKAYDADARVIEPLRAAWQAGRHSTQEKSQGGPPLR